MTFNLTDFGGVGDGVTLNTEAFQRAILAISKLGKKGGGQLNVPAGRWLTAPFNLTSHMTLFLAEDAVILGIDVSLFCLFVGFMLDLDFDSCFQKESTLLENTPIRKFKKNSFT